MLPIEQSQSPLSNGNNEPLQATLGYFCDDEETIAAWFVKNIGDKPLGYQVFLGDEQIASKEILPGRKHNGNDKRAVGYGEYEVTTDFGQTTVAILLYDTSSVPCDE